MLRISLATQNSHRVAIVSLHCIFEIEAAVWKIGLTLQNSDRLVVLHLLERGCSVKKKYYPTKCFTEY